MIVSIDVYNNLKNMYEIAQNDIQEYENYLKANELLLNELEKLFDSILCLVAEGQEVLSRVQICEEIKKEAFKGIKLLNPEK